MTNKRLLQILYRKIKRKTRKLFYPEKSLLPNLLERVRVASIPPKHTFSTSFLNKKILVSDSKWYLPTLKEIWGTQIYKFNASSKKPFIIDCGANIGLSVLYWKYLYPDSKIIAFEPDPAIFKILENNLTQFNYQGIEFRNLAVWSSESEMSFQVDNSVGGKIIQAENIPNVIKVKTFRLKNLLKQHIDMLKIDIEGAEYEVLKDCQEKLFLVDHLFVEYHGWMSQTQKLHEILEMVNHAGFRYHIKEANPINHPFIFQELNKLYDLQLNIFAFRV